MNILHLVAGGLVLVGIPLALWGVHNYRRQGARYADANARCFKGSATVVEARVLERERTGNDNSSYTYYEPRLHYRYAVDGADLEGNRVALCGASHFSSPARAEAWRQTHLPGAIIDLWYDPARPSDSAPVLDRPSLFGAIVTVIAGLALAAMSVAIIGSGL